MSNETHDRLVAALPDYRRWLGAVARNMCGFTHREHQADLMQEGYIAMWRACAKVDLDKGAAASYLTKAAEMRMSDVARRGFRNWTGREAMRGSREVNTVASVDELTDAGALHVPDVLAAAAIDDAIWGYHHGEIAEALAALTPTEREYVVARFWHGYQGPELDELFGNGSRAHWYRARPKLAEHLEHLGHLVDA